MNIQIGMRIGTNNRMSILASRFRNEVAMHPTTDFSDWFSKALPNYSYGLASRIVASWENAMSVKMVIANEKAMANVTAYKVP